MCIEVLVPIICHLPTWIAEIQELQCITQLCTQMYNTKLHVNAHKSSEHFRIYAFEKRNISLCVTEAL